MSNSFPAVPGGFALAQVSYQAVMPRPDLVPGTSLDFGAGVSTQLSYMTPVIGLVFSFTAPGSFGSFDQAAVEAALSGAVTQILQVLAGMSGAALAGLQSQTSVIRTWEWQNGTGAAFATQDTMAYP